MRTFLVLFFLLIYISSYSQAKYERGYFIDNQNSKTECLIKNIDWKDNPTDFKYKISETTDPINADISTIKEFGIINFSKYIRAKVQIDVSPDEVEKLSYKRNPIWSQDTLFLKVLVDGDASLYCYVNKNLTRFFYSVKNSPIQQLIHKQFKIDPNTMMFNEDFRQQLWNDVKSKDISLNKIKNISYDENDLSKYFKNYNELKGEKIVDLKPKSKAFIFNLRFTTGIDYSSLTVYSSTIYPKTVFDNKISFRFGLEAESILPFNRHRWGLILEPTFQYYNDTKTHEYISGYMQELKIYTSTIKYKSIEIPFGVRYYIINSEKSKIFINGLFISDISFKSTIKFEGFRVLKLDTGINYGFGLGFYFKKISGELRYYSNREILNNNDLYSSKYSKLSLIIGYKIF